MATRGYRTIRSNGREVGPIGHELLRGNRGQEVQAVGSESNGADLMRGLNGALATANGREVMAVRSTSNGYDLTKVEDLSRAGVG